MVMVTARVRRRLLADFGPQGDAMADRVARMVASAPMAELQDPERLQAAVVLAAEGSLERFERLLAQLMHDWRDLLMSAGLANFDWPARLDAELGAE